MGADVDRPGPVPVRWDELRRSLLTQAQRDALAAEDLDRLAVAAFLTGWEEESADAWGRAHHAWAGRGEVDRAARAAFWAGFGALLRGEPARASGWFQRGGRMVAGHPGCAAAGYLLVPEAMVALGEGDLARARELYERVATIAAGCGDVDLSAVALLGRGEVAIAGRRVAEGLALLDEAMLGATSGEVSPVMTGILYCASIDACLSVLDLRRAQEWTDALDRWCRQHPELVPYRGQCLVHRSQVLQAHGRWAQALSEASQAGVRLTSPPHPAAGLAWYQQGELHRLRGELAEAESAYREASRLGRDPVPGLALLRVLQGRPDAALGMVRRALDERSGPHRRVPVLPAAVEVALAAGDRAAASGAADELAGLADELGLPVVVASALEARARVAVDAGEPAAALVAAREAQARWRALGMPYEVARAGVLVAQACRALGDGDTAGLELESAARTFDELGAGPDRERSERLREPTGRERSGLTEREVEVLRLVAGGGTNRDIGAALSISEHTVARHVQNIFTKLGVSSRAAATSHAHAHHLL